MSGASTSIGIEYQQRVGAYLACLLLAKADPRAFGLTSLAGPPEALGFEGAAAIDDIVVRFRSGRLFIQAKRSISLTDADGTEFDSVVGQFVRQHLGGRTDDSDEYHLVTTHDASGLIRGELNKVLLSFRSAQDRADLPMSAAEVRADACLRTCVRRHWLAATRGYPSEGEISSLARKIRVTILEVGPGGVDERAALLLLGHRDAVGAGPVLLWAFIAQLCLEPQSRRLALDLAGIERRLLSYQQSDEAPDLASGQALAVEWTRDTVPAGREVLLAQPPGVDDKLMLMEVRRFEDDGRPRVLFPGFNRLTFPGSDTEFGLRGRQ